MAETKYEKAVNDLVNKMTGMKGTLEDNLSYYESEFRLKALGLSTPPELRFLTANIGWPRMYLDSLEERLDLQDFREADGAEGDERLRKWWQQNRMDISSGMGHLEAMIHGVAYVTVAAPDEESGDDPETPIFSVESPFDFIADLDFRTGKPKSALRFYRHPQFPQEDRATLFLPDETVFLARGGPYAQWRVDDKIEHELGRVPVALLVNRERLSERFGRSEITQEIRSATDAASRILMNLQTASELMAVPQRILMGVAESEFAANPSDPGAVWDAYMARMLAFESDQVKAYQFSAADLRNFTEALQELAKQVASYTGLPPQYLSFSSENPASAEAIKSSESRMVKKAERKSRVFGGGWEEMMRLGVLVMDGSIPTEMYRLESVWADPSTPTFASKADGVTKLHADGVIPTEQARIEMGYTDVQRKQMQEWDKSDPTSQLNAILNPPVQPTTTTQTGATSGTRSVRRPTG